MKTRLRHQRKQTERFERNRLTAGIRTGDDQRIEIAAQTDVDRHDLFGIEQGMARTLQIDHTVLVELRFGGIHAVGKLRLRKDERKLCDIVIIKRECRCAFRNRLRQDSQNAFDLLLFLVFKEAKLVVCLNNGQRFYEQRCARCGGVVDQTLDLVSVFRLDGNDITSVSLRDDVFLQILGKGLSRRVFLQIFLDPAVRRADLAADVGKLGACFVRNHVLGKDRLCDAVLQIPVGGQAVKHLVKRGLKPFVGIDIVVEHSCHAQHVCHAQKLGR